MNSLDKKLSDRQQQLIGLTIWGLIVFALHFLVDTNSCDDLWIKEQVLSKSIPDFLVERYNTWTARLFLEFAHAIVLKMPTIVWRITDTFMCVIVAYCLGLIILPEGQRKSSVLYALLLFLSPLEYYGSAGYGTTTIGYIWPMALGLITILPMAMQLKGIETHSSKSLLRLQIAGALCALYATNHEQVAALIAGIAIVSEIFSLCEQKKLTVYPIIILVITTLEMIAALTCPGNDQRVATEIISHFPEFLYLTFTQKLVMGFLSESVYFLGLIQFNWICTFLLVAMIITLVAKKKYFAAVIQLPPLLLILAERVQFYLSGSGLNISFLHLMQNDLPAPLSEYSATAILVECIVYLALWALIFVGIFMCADSSREGIIFLLILAAGFLSRLIIGFSPSIFVSGYRTAMFMNLAIIILGGTLISRHKHKLLWILYLGIVLLEIV